MATKDIKGGFSVEPFYAFDRIQGFEVTFGAMPVAEIKLRDIDDLVTFEGPELPECSKSWIYEFANAAKAAQRAGSAALEAWFTEYDRFTV